MAKYLRTFLSAFTGLGGLDLGLEKAGFRNVGCIEIDAIARQSIKANRPHCRLIEPNDIIEVAVRLSPSDLGLRRRQLFMLAGGPPCQPFSKAAQWSHKAMKGLRDPRAKCFASFIQLIERFLPKVVLIENVQGFVSRRGGALTKLKRSLRQINSEHRTKYRVSSRVVDAADFGVPQRRQRAIIVVLRDGADFEFPPATALGDPITTWDALCNLPKKRKSAASLPHWGRLLSSIPEGKNYLWHTRYGGGKQLFGYRTRFWSFLLKLSKWQPAWTISAQPGPYTGPFHWENRALTTRELLRLQSFPASWKVRGSASDRVRQIGNATPPLLAEIIGRSISKQLLGTSFRGLPRLQIPRSSAQPPAAARLSRVPRSFLPLVKRRPDHPGTGLGPAPILTPSNDAQKDRNAA